MGLDLKCPKCLYVFDPREVTKNQDIVAIIRMQADFAPQGKLVFEYAELFETTRPVKEAKLLRILSEVREMWTSGKFALNKRVHVISKEGLAAALKTVCNKRFEVPLENHNYLKKVMVTVSETEAAKRSVADERALKEREDRLRATSRPVDPKDDTAPAPIGELAKKLPWSRG
ncbi:MAG: hypothetical protein HY889_10340 [Deltaproteobacteria bacterium]|nr:hypothetical protein [Deltaproteobacteria bacterium]